MNEEELAAKAAKQIIIHEKEMEMQSMKLKDTKQQQRSALQDKLNERIKKREEKQALEKEKKIAEEAKVKPPTGHVTFALVTIKGIASILEAVGDDVAMKTLEDMHDLITEELDSHNVYKVKDEIGKFLLASNNVEDMLNLALKVQEKYNANKWSDLITKLPPFKKLFRPEDSSKSDSVPLFNGPRVSFGIHSGDATPKLDGSGNASYSGINIIKVEAVGNFAQGGQIIISGSTCDNVDQSKLSKNHVTQLGVYKLEGFGAGCKLAEILPSSLQDRSKFFGSVCAHCNEVIQPNEKFFRAVGCIWHMNHFRCFQCNIDLEGSFLEFEGSPYCKNCYLSKSAPKCKNCSNPITSGYINALGGYWHADCFSCKRCLKKPSAEVPIYEHGGFPYCGDCYKQVATD